MIKLISLTEINYFFLILFQTCLKKILSNVEIESTGKIWRKFVKLTISPSSPPKSSQRSLAPSSADILSLSKDLRHRGVGGEPGLTPDPATPLAPAA